MLFKQDTKLNRGGTRRLLASLLIGTAVAGLAGEARAQCEMDRFRPMYGEPSFFGKALAMDGDFAIIGAPGKSFQPTLPGFAYMYEYDGVQWNLHNRFEAADGMVGDYFGCSVAMCGSVAAIGASLDNNENGDAAGAVYVYCLIDGVWCEQTKLLASDGSPHDNFGSSVAVSNDVIIASAPLDYYSGGGNGSAYVFRFDGATWKEEAKFRPADADAKYFGRTIAFSDKLAVFEATLHDKPSSHFYGAVFVFRFDGSSWIEDAMLLPSDPGEFLSFGCAVAVDNDRIIIGAPGEDVFGVGSVHTTRRHRCPGSLLVCAG